MSAQPDKNAPLRSDIRHLGRLLGDVLKEQVGSYLFELEEDVRTLCKNSRLSSQSNIVNSIRSQIAEQPTDTLIDLTKAFGIYFQLVNIAEQNHRIRRKHHYEIKGDIIKYSLEHLMEFLKKHPMDDLSLQAVLSKIQITPVLTAHPTHIMRQTLLRKHRRISRRLFEKEQMLPPWQQRRNTEKLKQEITLLWQTNPFHSRQLNIQDEVENLFTYFDESLWETLPQIHQDFEDLLHDQGRAVKVPTMIRFGSWVGGDRDGHPFVTAELTYKTLKQQKSYTLKRYMKTITELQDHYSISLKNQPVTEALQQSLENDRLAMPRHAAETQEYYNQEIYRQKFAFIHEKLDHTLKKVANPNQSLDIQTWYPKEESFAQDIHTLVESLRLHRGEAVLAPILHLQRQIEIFGFYLTCLDIRQNADRHRETVAELMAIAGLEENYLALSETEKSELLLQEIQSPRPLLSPFVTLSSESQEVIDTLKIVRKCLLEISPGAVQNYVISMCRYESDLLHVLILARETGLARLQGPEIYSALQIVPLFETVADLQAAPEIMKSIFKRPFYQKILEGFKRSQEVMIGYSDSAKQGGILAATWHLYQAQRNLMDMAKAEQIHLRFFHGRGGTISRGGGPSHHAIRAQHTDTMLGDIRLTEQGEVLAWKYNFPELAHRNLSVLLSAVLEVSLNHSPENLSQDWENSMQELAEDSQKAYGELIHKHPGFIPYFQQSTPLEAINQLNIGSRPSRRKETKSIDDLRAIPWVFAWMQSRCVLPAWFGVGSGLKQYLKRHSDGLLNLQTMYEQWLFFHTFIDNLQMTLSKADLRIAECYSHLVQPESLRKEIWEILATEYQDVVKIVLQITDQSELLEKNSTLKRSIALRNPYVDPLNYIQLEILQRLQAEGNHVALQKCLELSIMGISEGLRNTG